MNLGFEAEGAARRPGALSVRLGDRVLEWMLRRLQQAVRLEHDLVLVQDGPALADVGPRIEVQSDSWRVARVSGELTLREALPEADRLLAIVPESFPPPPLDIAGRTYLKRILAPRAEDLVAAVSDRFCEALLDESLVRAVFDSLDTLRATVGRWSLGGPVTAREVRSMLVGAVLGAARLDRERDFELLARWIQEGAPAFRGLGRRAPKDDPEPQVSDRPSTLVRDALVEAQPRTGAWLGWALTEGSLELLCTAGALLASPEGEAKAPKIPELAAADRGQLIDLVEAALREVWRSAPPRARAMLVEAERTARQVELDAGRHRLLRVPLEGALSRAANLAAEGRPPDDLEIEGLKRNLHAPELAESIEFVANLARLARFQRIEIPSGEESAFAWIGHALQDVAWADLAYRQVRRDLEKVPAWLGDPARRILEAWVSRRDLLNTGFAEALATHWASLASNSDPRHPFALHQITRCVVRRLLDDGSRVFLLVLDGCDLASFLEILQSLSPDRRIGLTLPEVRDAVLHEDLRQMKALGAALSPLPTVTSHARRALFAGEIPGNAALDDTESAAPNATADHRAWDRNTALGSIPRRLFLKGDLGATGQPLLEALRSGDTRLVAAVVNGVDDALSSKETTPLPRWSLGALGAGAAEAVQVAIDEGWCILATADHGHTPFVSPDRKIAATALGHRFSAEACEGAVTFRNGPLPRRPLHLLTRFGAWFGHQRRGFHGGAGIEEVVVPLAFLGRVRGEQEGRPLAPAWWWSAESASDPLPRAAPRRAAVSHAGPPPTPPSRSSIDLGFGAEGAERRPGAPSVDLDVRLDSLTSEEKRVVVLIQQNQSVRLSILAHYVKKPPVRASGFMQQLVRKLFDLGYPCVTVEMLQDGDRLYRYQPVDRGKR